MVRSANYKQKNADVPTLHKTSELAANPELNEPAGPEMHEIGTPSDYGSATSEVLRPSFLAPQAGSEASVSSAFPWWPSDAIVAGGNFPDSLAYHATTQMPDGRISMIVDPGAWTNLIGAKLARKLTMRVLQAGLKPVQERMTPMSIQGVGSGSQTCNWRINTPIAVTDKGDESSIHKILIPIVEGSGEELPGLFGLRSQEELRAIMDTGNRMLHFPGPGEVQIILPPGSTSVPLHKVPSGHLVMIIDDFEKVSKHPKGAIPERTLQLHATDQVGLTPGAASSQPSEEAPRSLDMKC